MRWGLLLLAALVGFGLWYARKPDRSHSAPEPELVTAEGQPARVAHGIPGPTAPAENQPGGDPCAGLELLDVEAGGDGSAQGVWLRNRQVGPSLVQPGGRFSSFTLTRIMAGSLGSGATRLWFGTNPRPCELKTVQGIDLARVLPAAPTLAKPAPDLVASFPASEAQEVREKETPDQVRNPRLTNLGWGRRAIGSGKTPGRLTPTSIDAGMP